ncbi:hypothetical protein C8R44DRAFT_866561 [Mycena epipterygia]|nr:hypothetical protein C8R44DRAFT_866561 [Mycena epipterygia]
MRSLRARSRCAESSPCLVSLRACAHRLDSLCADGNGDGDGSRHALTGWPALFLAWSAFGDARSGRVTLELLAFSSEVLGLPFLGSSRSLSPSRCPRASVERHWTRAPPGSSRLSCLAASLIRARVYCPPRALHLAMSETVCSSIFGVEASSCTAPLVVVLRALTSSPPRFIARSSLAHPFVPAHTLKSYPAGFCWILISGTSQTTPAQIYTRRYEYAAIADGRRESTVKYTWPWSSCGETKKLPSDGIHNLRSAITLLPDTAPARYTFIPSYKKVVKQPCPPPSSSYPHPTHITSTTMLSNLKLVLLTAAVAFMAVSEVAYVVPSAP